MARKDAAQRKIDKPMPYVGGGLIVGEATTAAPPAVPSALLPPTGLTIGTMFVPASAVTPTATVNLDWDPPPGSAAPVDYAVQWALNSGFTTSLTTVYKGGTRTDMALAGLPTGTAFWVRVAGVYSGYGLGPWSASDNDITPADLTAPAAATSLVTSWSGQTGDLTISWTPPTSTNYRDTRIRIYASNGGALLRETHKAGAPFVWTRAQQSADTSGSYDPSVYLVLTSRSWSNVYAATDLTATATLSAPSSPSGLTHTWSGDTGTAAADLTITWTIGAVAGYRLTLDGVARNVGPTDRYVYPFDMNRAEHSGTPDPAVSISLIALDALGQVSSAATATATNAAPPAASASAAGTFAQLAITITPSTAADLLDYRIRTYLNGSGTPTDTIYTAETLYLYEPASTGSWRVDVAARDKFGQVGTASSLTTAADLQSMTQFVTTLRAGLIYSDSTSTAEATLAALKDGQTASNTVVYTASTPWRWTMGDWQGEVVHQTSEFYSTGSASYYIGTSLDGSSWTWYAGGTATGGRWLPVSQASEAAAQTAATTLAAGLWRFDLPAPARARYIRLGHRNTTTSYAFREFFPSTLIRGTYVEAESITTVQIAAGAVTADRITVTTLSSITANIGTVTAGAINGVTITGGTVQTAASGARAELTSAGLKTYDSAGVVQVEATTSTDGALKAGAGTVVLDDTGIMADTTGSYAANRGYRIMRGSTQIGGLHGWGTASSIHTIQVRADEIASEDAALELIAYHETSGTAGTATLAAYYQGGAKFAQVVGATTATTGTLALDATTSVNINSSTSGSTFNVNGLTTATLEDAVTNATTTVLNLIHNSSGTPAANFGAQIRFGLESSTTANTSAAAVEAFWGTATHASRAGVIRLVAVDSGGAREGVRVSGNGSAALLGFYGGAGGAKPTVTGSRGGNAALASLLTALAGLGLLTDSSS